MITTKNNKVPKLTLVGGGPGDPDLITIKGIKSLQNADVVLYDALVHPDLLKYARPEIPMINVGKRAGQHSMTQNDINDLIVKCAYEFGHVVRLKGGDPFVFGRGCEEIEFASSYGIKADVVPGISSAIAVPALQQIPLTKRGINESFWVLTGTTKAGETSADLELAAESSATLIILMGINKLSEIMQVFKRKGKQALPVAVIQNGSLPDEKIAIGTVETIQAEVVKKNISSPAIIVVGEVVLEHPNLDRVVQADQWKQVEYQIEALTKVA